MSPASGPVVPRLQLANELRDLRSETNATLDDVAEATLISSSKLSRLENAQGSPQLRDVRDLVRHYGIEGTERGNKLLRLQRAASKKAWWTEYSFEITGFAAGVSEHVAFESDATVSRVYAIPFLPALLQVEDYTRELYRSLEPWRSKDDVEQLLGLRHARKSALVARAELPPLELVAVTHECALRQFVGSRQIMRRQLLSLSEEWTEKPNVELRVLPFSAAPTFTSTCMYTYFEFGDALDRDVVHIETHAGFRSIETDKGRSQYRRHFDDLLRRSLGRAESLDVIQAAADSWR